MLHGTAFDFKSLKLTQNNKKIPRNTSRKVSHITSHWGSSVLQKFSLIGSPGATALLTYQPRYDPLASNQCCGSNFMQLPVTETLCSGNKFNLSALDEFQIFNYGKGGLAIICIRHNSLAPALTLSNSVILVFLLWVRAWKTKSKLKDIYLFYIFSLRDVKCFSTLT